MREADGGGRGHLSRDPLWDVQAAGRTGPGRLAGADALLASGHPPRRHLRGGRRRQLPRLAKAVQQGWFVFPGRKDTRKAAIYVKDVEELTEWLLDHEFDRMTVNAVYDQASTVEEIVTYMREATGTDRMRTITVPEGLARAAVSTLGIAQAHKPPVDRTFHTRRGGSTSSCRRATSSARCFRPSRSACHATCAAP